ncbi:MAG: hypothetical protein QOF76_1492 [Solirubrobacteraceae bacterium]|nr:hypothetical protein [Solirubrobacteraceae bacterium]
MRRLILDDGLPRALAAELRGRGRAATTLGELGLECATDAEVLALDGVLVTTVRIHAPGATVALVRGNRREAVHRHAHEMARQRPGSLRRYIG